MKYLLRSILAIAACVLFIASPAKAAFHTYRIVEVYSSADGCVQFVRLHESLGGTFQSSWSGLTLTCTSGNVTNTFTFPSNLSSTATANTDVLVATANFAALPGGITPDFILPPGFLFTGGGTLVFGGFASTVTYGALPTNGQSSVNAAGTPAVNTPANFAGAHGSVNVPSGVCCVGASCSISVQTCCTGTWTSGGSCAASPCAPPAGVCCAGVTCRTDTAANCTGANTLFVSTPACNGAGNNATPCCRADFNHVGGISVQDIFDFLSFWFAGSTTADFNGNGAGMPSVQSIFSFLSAWFAGC